MEQQQQNIIAQMVRYEVNDVQIAKLRKEYGDLSFDDPEAYEVGRKAIAHVRSLRTAVESRRKELKEESLRTGRMIDTVAKDLTAKLEEIELPLKERKAAVDDAKERARRAAEDAARAEAEEKAKAERQAEEARIAEERAKLEAQQAVFAEAQRKADEARRAADEAARVESERVAAEQRAAQAKLDADRAELERQQRAVREKEEKAAETERLRLARIKADEELAADTERERVAAEARAVADAAGREAAAARAEAIRPDIDKLRAWAAAIREFSYTAPALESDEAADAIGWSTGRLEWVAMTLEKFKPKAG